jgi:hypothetical protein
MPAMGTKGPRGSSGRSRLGRPAVPLTAVVASAAILGFAVSGEVVAQPSVPPKLESAILARVLGADRSLPARVGRSLVIGLVFRAGAAGSANLAAMEAYEALGGQTIIDLPAQARGRAYRDRADLEAWVEREGIDALRVADGLSAEIAEISGVCEARKLLCASPNLDYVKAGLAVGVSLRNDKPRLVVDLRHARAAGIDLDPKVLEVAEVLP